MVPSMTRVKLDATDLRILSALQRHGRLSKARLAGLVNLSASPAWTRLKRLEEAGIVRGYHADVDIGRIASATMVLVEITLKQHRYADFERFERHVRGIDEIVECHATGGGVDYVMKVVVPGIEAYQGLIDRLLIADIGIDRYFTYVVTREVKTGPANLAGLVAAEIGLRTPDRTVEIAQFSPLGPIRYGSSVRVAVAPSGTMPPDARCRPVSPRLMLVEHPRKGTAVENAHQRPTRPLGSRTLLPPFNPPRPIRPR